MIAIHFHVSFTRSENNNRKTLFDICTIDDDDDEIKKGNKGICMKHEHFNLYSFDIYEILEHSIQQFSYCGILVISFTSQQKPREGLNPQLENIFWLVIIVISCALLASPPTVFFSPSSSLLSFHSLNNGQLKVSRCNLTKWKASINFSNPNSPSFWMVLALLFALPLELFYFCWINGKLN